jgi:DNA-directed RNA polymerase specialized sigma24 family protein
MDELIQDTLTALFREKGALHACYRSADSLDDFLNYLLNRAARHWYREWDRRRRREVLLPHAELAKFTASESPPAMERELVQRLVQSLTPAEKNYFDWALAQQEGTSPCPYSKSYSRQLKHRILEKACRLLFGD